MTAKFIALSKEPASAVTGCLAFFSLIWRTSSINLMKQLAFLIFLFLALVFVFLWRACVFLHLFVFYLNLNTNSPFAFIFSFTAGEPMISHKEEGDASDGYTYSTSIGSQTVGDTYNWGSQTADTRKEYAIGVTLGPGECHSLSLTDTYCHPLILTVSHCHPLSLIFNHCHSFSPWVSSR